MPRRENPGNISTGSGRKDVTVQDNLPLSGGGMGDVHVVPFGQSGGGDQESLRAHTNSTRAHRALAISTEGMPDKLYPANVAWAADAWNNSMPPMPPFLGRSSRTTSFSGIPDWGTLKLNDSALTTRGMNSPNDPGDIYPYYFQIPSPASDIAFEPQGEDPHSDPVWNSDAGFLGNGVGPGQCYAGGWTRPGNNNDQPVTRTCRTMLRTPVIDGVTGRPERQIVTISGSLFPADRGVLALFHWPMAGTVGDFLAQPLLDRCVAALLLGQGIEGSVAVSSNPKVDAVEIGRFLGDGQPGGIFALGAQDGDYNPMAFPGKGTGQYNLRELAHGTSDIDSSPLKEPWNDLNDDGNPGFFAIANSGQPAPGQVRLGLIAESGLVGETYGIPVLGATLSYYDPVTVPPNLDGLGIPHVGNTMLTDFNFFDYRLPYLVDYTVNGGLRHTPRGEYPTTKEAYRYYDPTSNNSGGPEIENGLLVKAGNYSGFEQDCLHWQLARYRHSFAMPSTQVAGLPEEVGTYWLVHFKTERGFESFTRDGIMPDDVAADYDVYGMDVAGALAGTSDLGAYGNTVNEETDPESESPGGPAPEYGYACLLYHTLKSNIVLDPVADTLIVGGDFTTTYSWASTSVPMTPQSMFCSGVQYFVPLQPADGVQSFTIDELEITVANFWQYTYRTDDAPLTGNPQAAPAVLSSPNPCFINVGCFSFEVDGGGAPRLDIPVGYTDVRGARPRRIEFPFQYCGLTPDGDAYADANGPLTAIGVEDNLYTSLPSTMRVLGDFTTPSFSHDAHIIAGVRKPWGHDSAETTVQPFDPDYGHGYYVPRGPDRILFHSGSFDMSNPANQGAYGNYTDAGAANQLYLSLTYYRIDFDERFLDETYRYHSRWSAAINVHLANASESLVGPGVRGLAGVPWVDTFIEVPVQAGFTTTTGFIAASWTRNLYQVASLESIAGPNFTTELQVSGLPSRNPPISAGVMYPFPSAGLLQYPHKDYSAGYRPDGTDVSVAQPDYSAASGDREYVRCFDAAYSKSGNPAAVAGQNFVIIRIDGLTLGDFAYVGPLDPGGLQGSTGIALMLKIPGLTTWMDMGRADGAGPTKNHQNSDGAGCRNPDGNATFDAIDDTTGMVYCHVMCSLEGIGLQESTGAYGDASTAGEVPVLIKVIMRDTTGAADYNLEKEADPNNPGTFIGIPKVGLSPDLVRGIVGIDIVRTDGQNTDPP